MQIKLLVSAAAIALVAGLTSASAADHFTTLAGVTVQPMNALELDSVRGGNGHGAGPPGIIFALPGTNPIMFGLASNPNAPPPVVVTKSGVHAGG